MLLCEDTIGYFPAHLLHAPSDKPRVTTVKDSQQSVATEYQPKLPDNVLARYGNVDVPKNKAARRRLAQSISENVDRISRATRFKKKSQSSSRQVLKAVREVTK